MAIVVPIVADTSGLVRNLTRGTSGLRTFGKAAALAAGAAGIGALTVTLRAGIGEWNQQQKVIAQTNAVLKSTRGVANVTAKGIDRLSTSIMKKTGIDDEAITSGQNLLLTFTKVRNEAGKGNDIFNQATVLMTDLSVAMGKDLSSSAMLVGKALNDPIKGVGALSRAGVQFTAAQKDQIKAMVESGDVMGAQKMILQELETQFGGSAEAAGKTLPGQLNVLKETFNNLAGELVATFMPTIARAAGKVADFLLDLTKAPTLQAKIEVITGAVGDVWTKIKTWWNTGERKELPSGIVITPPGSAQVNRALGDLKASLDSGIDRVGKQLGYSLAAALFGGATAEAGRRGKAAGNSIVGFLFVNTAAIDLGRRLGSAIVEGFRSFFDESGRSLGREIVDGWLKSMLDAGLGPAFSIGKNLIDKVREGAEAAGRSGRAIDPFKGIVTDGKKNKLTETVREAVRSAREQLKSLSGSLLSLVTSARSQMATANSRASGALLKDQRDLEDERYRLEKTRLENAANAAEATDDDRLALKEFNLQREMQLRERDLADQEAADKAKIDGLTDQFNRGEISAAEFQASLKGYLGEDFGVSLGEAFVKGFKDEFQSVINLANDIFNTVGGRVPSGADQATPVADALRESNQARFDAALDLWREYQKKKKELDDGDITRSQFNKWVKNNNPPRKRPTREEFGLALGGVLKKQVFTAGEAGPEAVMPLTGRGGVMLREALGLDGNHGATYNITINAGLGTSGTDLGREVVRAIKQYERTNGNVFASA